MEKKKEIKQEKEIEEIRSNREEETEFETTTNQKNEYVDNGTFKIDKLILVLDKEGRFITQARFNYEEKTQFTYSPKLYTEVKEMIKGFETLKRVNKSYELTAVPEKLIKINKLINYNGEIKINTAYWIFNTTNKDGEKVSYNYLREKEYNSLMVLDKNNKEIAL